MDQTGGQNPGINLTSSLFLVPLEAVGMACLLLSCRSTSAETSQLRTQGSLRTEPGLCRRDLTQSDLVFLAPYHLPRAMRTGH